MTTLTAERVRELFRYERVTGIFTRRLRRGPTGAGKAAGTLTARGFIQIMIDGRYYAAHRLAWLYVHGEWPEQVVEHRNLRLDDNRWRNIRGTSFSVNRHKRRAQANNTTGHTGVSRSGSNWKAEIDVDEQRHYLGSFEKVEDAAIAYASKKRELGRMSGEQRLTAS